MTHPQDLAQLVAELRAELDVIKQENRELTEQRDAARVECEAAEMRLVAVLDGTFSVGDGTAQREIERLRAECDRMRPVYAAAIEYCEGDGTTDDIFEAVDALARSLVFDAALSHREDKP